jgi:hypothetical protein
LTPSFDFVIKCLFQFYFAHGNIVYIVPIVESISQQANLSIVPARVFLIQDGLLYSRALDLGLIIVSHAARMASNAGNDDIFRAAFARFAPVVWPSWPSYAE